MDSMRGSTSTLTPLASQLRVSATLEINELVQEQQRQGLKIVHMGFGEATFPIPTGVVVAHKEATFVTSYLPVAGQMKLKEVSAVQIFTS
jgi:aspartate aminotransferase